MTSITVLDGADTIGGNKILLEEKGRGLLLDFGMNFARYGAYYQEFLKAEGDVLRALVLFSRAMRARSRACTARVIET
ncbi:hypothetical protein MUO93_07615 [Candidatus Bathyarchaeota archaeon]|nr:hypothetical protein [Candidatus Bathyarchaeota archaeon]